MVCMYIRSGNILNLLNRIMREFSDTIFFVIDIDQKLGCNLHYIFLSTLNFSSHSLKNINRMYKVTLHKSFFPVPQNMNDVRDLSFSLRDDDFLLV